MFLFIYFLFIYLFSDGFDSTLVNYVFMKANLET